jgi:hypothetical protein
MNNAAAFLRRAAWIAVLTAVVMAYFSARGAGKRIVLIAGKPSHPPGMHEFRAGCLLFQKALGSVPGVTVQVFDGGWPSKTADGGRVDDDAALENADAVFIYADGGRGNPAIQGNRLNILESLAARGIGFGFAHYAVEVPVGAPGDAMHRWIGGFYEDQFSVNPMWKPAFDHLPNHPVVRDTRRVVLQHALADGPGCHATDRTHTGGHAQR